MLVCTVADPGWPSDDSHDTKGITRYYGPKHSCGLGPGHAGRHRCRCGLRSIDENTEARPDSGRPIQARP